MEDAAPPHSAPRAGSVLWLLIVVFVAGAALMAYELAGSRLLAPFFGNSIFVWGSLIGVFLAALSTGYTVGGAIADRFPTPRALAFVLAASAALVLVTVATNQAAQRAVIDWQLGQRMAPLVAAVILFGPASICMGMVSPFAVRLRARSLAELGRTAGNLYGLSTLGSIVGTLGTAFWLIPEMGSTDLVLAVAASLGVCSLLCGIGGRSPAGAGAGLAMIGASLLLLGGGFGESAGRLAPETRGWQPTVRDKVDAQKAEIPPGSEVLTEFDSQYHHILVVDSPSFVSGGTIESGPGGLRALRFDNSYQSGAPLSRDGEVDLSLPPSFRYAHVHDLVPLYRPQATRVLYLGLGAGTLPMRMHQRNPDMQIDAVEIDPRVRDMAVEYFAFDDEAIDVHIEDARTWLTASDEQWDVIVIDTYYSDSIPFHLTTREFLEEVQGHLTEDGLVVANIIGALEGSRSDLLRSMYRTYDDVFDNIALHPVRLRQYGGEQFDPDRTGHTYARELDNIELFASNGELATYQEIVTAARDAARGRGGVLATVPDLAANRYDAELEALDEVPVLTDDYAPVDALLSFEDT